MAASAPAKSKKSQSKRSKPAVARALQPKAALVKTTTKTTDDKGRVVLGGRFANRSVIVEQLSETEIIIKLARVIPEREAWIYDDAEALSAVRSGLKQARAGETTRGPEVAADADLAAALED